jgi:hypothetical protein
MKKRTEESKQEAVHKPESQLVCAGNIHSSKVNTECI